MHYTNFKKMVYKGTFKKAYKHTDVHEGVMLHSRFSPQVTQNEDNGQAIGLCYKKSCATLSKSSDTVKILSAKP